MEKQNLLEAGIVDDEDLRVIYQESLRHVQDGDTEGFLGMKAIPCLRNGLLVRVPIEEVYDYADLESCLELRKLATAREVQRIEAMKGVLEAIKPFSNGRSINEALQFVFYSLGE